MPCFPSGEKHKMWALDGSVEGTQPLSQAWGAAPCDPVKASRSPSSTSCSGLLRVGRIRKSVWGLPEDGMAQMSSSRHHLARTVRKLWGGSFARHERHVARWSEHLRLSLAPQTGVLTACAGTAPSVLQLLGRAHARVKRKTARPPGTTTCGHES